MPLYEYECDACGHRFEVIQKFSDPPIEKCPKCGSPVRKLLSSPAIQFKGSGWYITDYAKKEPAAAGAKSDSDKPAETAAKVAKADAKTEKKSETTESTASPKAPAGPGK